MEQAAINNVEKEEQQKAKRSRRTRGQIREEHLVRITENLKTLHKRLTEICNDQCSEEQVRVWCIDVLKLALGYDSRNIDTEVVALGVSEIDMANFYLLTQRALFNGETDAEFHRQHASNNERILKAISSERVVTMIGRVLSEEYLTQSGQKIVLDDEFVASRLAEMLTPDVL